MPEILFVSTEAADFSGVHSATTNHIDTNYVDTGVSCYAGTFSDHPFWTEHAAANSNGVYWCHFRFLHTSANYFAADGHMMAFDDANGNQLGMLDIQDGKVRARATGDTTTYGALVSYGTNSLKTFDVSIDLSVANTITVTLYFDGVAVSTATAANTSGKTGCAKTIWTHNDMGNTGGTAYYSEFLITSDISTIGKRVALLRSNTAGTYAEWDGNLASVSDGDDATLLMSNTAGHRFSYNPTAFAGAATTIVAVALKSTIERPTGPNGPTGIMDLMRIGGADHTGTPHVPTPGAGLQKFMEVFETNPATSAAWTVAEINATEYGFQSAA